MSSFAIDGLVSGLDTTGLVNSLMQIERIPQQRLQLNLRAQNTSVTSYQLVASRMASIETAVAALSKDGAWDSRSSTVTGTSLTATVATGALPGKTSVEVLTLATAARFTSAATYAMDGPVTADGADITVTSASGDPVVITPASSSLTDVVSALNARSADTGLTAVAVKVGTDQYRLQLRATETGSGTPPTVTGLTETATFTPGTDATYRVDGVDGTSRSNTVTDLLPGLTVTFAEVGTSSVTVASNAAATTAAVKAMVTAVNAALDEIGTQTIKGGAEATTRGALASDSQIRSITGDLLRAVSDSFGGKSAASVGLQTTRDGKLVFDEQVFTAAYAADPAGTRAMIAPAAVPGAATVPDGIAKRLSAVVDRSTNPDNGTITNAVQGREQSVKDLQTAIESWDRRLETRRAALQRQFSGLEVALGRMQSQSGFLAGALGNLSANAPR